VNTTKCPTHPNKISDIFCVDDNALICSSCAFLSHGGHKCVGISEGINLLKSEIEAFGMEEEIPNMIKTVDSTKEKLKELSKNYEIEKKDLENKLHNLKINFEKEVESSETSIKKFKTAMESINEIKQISQSETTISALLKGRKDLKEMDLEKYSMLGLIERLKPFQKFNYENDKEIEKIVSDKQVSELIKKRTDWIHGLTDKVTKELLYRCIIHAGNELEKEKCFFSYQKGEYIHLTWIYRLKNNYSYLIPEASYFLPKGFPNHFAESYFHENNDDEAVYLRGSSLLFGFGSELNQKEAFEKFSQTEKYPGSQLMLYLCYEKGFHVKKDYKMAEKYLKMAFDQNFPIAQLCYYVNERKYSSIDPSQSSYAQMLFGNEDMKEPKHLIIASERGCSFAQFVSGVCKLTGEFLEKDTTRAIELLELSSKQG
jgi:hypothetical protein